MNIEIAGRIAKGNDNKMNIEIAGRIAKGNDNKMNIEIAGRTTKGNKAYFANAKLTKSKFLKKKITKTMASGCYGRSKKKLKVKKLEGNG